LNAPLHEAVAFATLHILKQRDRTTIDAARKWMRAIITIVDLNQIEVDIDPDKSVGLAALGWAGCWCSVYV